MHVGHNLTYIWYLTQNNNCDMLMSNLIKRYCFNYNYMNRLAYSILSLAVAGGIGYLFQKNADYHLDRVDLIAIIIKLRKSIFSTLRQIAYVANCLKIQESGIEPKKIKQIMMKDGASAQIKLEIIQLLVLSSFNITRQLFEKSCNHYSHNDIQIKMLLQNFKNDIQMALDGSVDSYHGSLPPLDGVKTIKVYREVVWRRMKIIQEKFSSDIQNKQCIKLQLQIQEYLEKEGIVNKKEASQKVFLALLQYHYKNNSQFKQQFESLQREFEDFIMQIKQKKKAETKK